MIYISCLVMCLVSIHAQCMINPYLLRRRKLLFGIHTFIIATFFVSASLSDGDDGYSIIYGTIFVMYILVSTASLWIALLTRQQYSMRLSTIYSRIMWLDNMGIGIAYNKTNKITSIINLDVGVSFSILDNIERIAKHAPYISTSISDVNNMSSIVEVYGDSFDEFVRGNVWTVVLAINRLDRRLSNAISDIVSIINNSNSSHFRLRISLIETKNVTTNDIHVCGG